MDHGTDVLTDLAIGVSGHDVQGPVPSMVGGDRRHRGDTPSPTLPPSQTRAELRRRLQTVACDVDQLWRDSLDSRDFELVTSSVEASHAIHRALLALDGDRIIIGGRTRGATS